LINDEEISILLISRRKIARVSELELGLNEEGSVGGEIESE